MDGREEVVEAYVWQGYGLSTPRVVEGLRRVNVAMVAVGGEHVAMVTDKGQVYTYGQGLYGQLGLGDTQNRGQPCLVEALVGKMVTYVACGLQHTAAITESGELYCWGQSMNGQVGAGAGNCFNSPQLVSPPGMVFANVACGDTHTVAVTVEGDCWVCGSGCQLGLGEKMPTAPALKRVELEGYLVESVACGSFHTIAVATMTTAAHQIGQVRQARVVFTWGHGSNGQLGHGDLLDRWRPTRVLALDGLDVVMVAGGMYHTVALTIDSQVYTWGAGSYGQLVDSTLRDRTPLPQLATALAGLRVYSVAAGEKGSLFLCSSGDSSIGELLFYGAASASVAGGTSGSAPQRSPKVPLEGINVKAVACGWRQAACLTLTCRSGAVETRQLLLQQLMASERSYLSRLLLLETHLLVPMAQRENFQGRASLEGMLPALNAIITWTSRLVLGLCGRMMYMCDSAQVIFDIVAAIDREEVAAAYESYVEYLADTIAMDMYGLWATVDGQTAEYANSCVEAATKAFPDKYENIWTPFYDDEEITTLARQSNAPKRSTLAASFQATFSSSAQLTKIFGASQTPTQPRPTPAERSKKNPLDILQLPLLRLKHYAVIFFGLFNSIQKPASQQWPPGLETLDLTCQRLGKLVEEAVSSIDEARRTNAFWKQNPQLSKTLLEPQRRLIAHSKDNKPLYALKQKGTWYPFATQWFVLFNDIFVHCAWSVSSYQLDTIWIELVQDSKEQKNAFKLLMPETAIILYTQTDAEKMQWISLISSAITYRLKAKTQFRRSLSHSPPPSSPHSPLVLRSGPNGFALLPPTVRRRVTYKFSSGHAVFKDAVYEGDWDNARMDGEGKMVLADGSVYVGRWAEGVMDQFGSLQTASGDVYIGQMRNNQIEGLGTMTYFTGDVYTGHWVNAKRHGYGSLQCQNGSVYVGGWVDDMRTGYGVLKNTDTGEKYLGMWRANMRLGQGVAVTEDTYSVGNFYHNKLDGHGVMVMEDGQRYEGEWSLGRVKGMGVLYLSNGHHISGTFQTYSHLRFETQAGSTDPHLSVTNMSTTGSFSDKTRAQEGHSRRASRSSLSVHSVESAMSMIQDDGSLSAQWDPAVKMLSAVYCKPDALPGRRPTGIEPVYSIRSRSHSDSASKCKYTLPSELDEVMRVYRPLYEDRYVPERVRWKVLVDAFKAAIQPLLEAQQHIEAMMPTPCHPAPAPHPIPIDPTNTPPTHLASSWPTSSSLPPIPSELGTGSSLENCVLGMSANVVDAAVAADSPASRPKSMAEGVSARPMIPHLSFDSTPKQKRRPQSLGHRRSNSGDARYRAFALKQHRGLPPTPQTPIDIAPAFQDTKGGRRQVENQTRVDITIGGDDTVLKRKSSTVSQTSRRSRSGFLELDTSRIFEPSDSQDTLEGADEEMSLDLEQQAMAVHMRLWSQYRTLAAMHNAGASRADSQAEALQGVVLEAFESRKHPLGQMAAALALAYRTSYFGQGAGRHLVHMGVLELYWALDTIYDGFVALFPETTTLRLLPAYSDPSAPPSQSSIGSYPRRLSGQNSRHSMSSLDLNIRRSSQQSYAECVTDDRLDARALIFDPVIFPMFYSPLMALYNQNVSDAVYWRNVNQLWEKEDTELLAYLGLREKLWLHEPSQEPPRPLTRRPSLYHASSMQRLAQAAAQSSEAQPPRANHAPPSTPKSSPGALEPITEGAAASSANQNGPSGAMSAPTSFGSDTHADESNNIERPSSLPSHLNDTQPDMAKPHIQVSANSRFFPDGREGRGDAPAAETQTKGRRYKEAIEEFRRLPDVHTPLQKMDVLKSSMATLQSAVTAHGIDVALWAMDDLLPLFLYLVIRARIPHLGAEIAFVEDFAQGAPTQGEHQVLLTTLKASYLHVRQELPCDPPAV